MPVESMVFRYGSGRGRICGGILLVCNRNHGRYDSPESKISSFRRGHGAVLAVDAGKQDVDAMEQAGFGKISVLLGPPLSERSAEIDYKSVHKKTDFL